MFFLKDYMHMHQMGSHFVGGDRLDFSPIEQEVYSASLQAFGSRWSKIAWEETKLKAPKSLNSSYKLVFCTQMLGKTSDQHFQHKKSKPSYFSSLFYTKRLSIYLYKTLQIAK